MIHLGARRGTGYHLDGLTQEECCSMWVKDGVSLLLLFIPQLSPGSPQSIYVAAGGAERQFYTSSSCQLTLQLAARTHKLSRQKVPPQFLLPTTCPRNTPYQVEEVIQPSSKILFFYLPNPRVLVRLMGCSVINTFCCRIHQGKGDADPLG